MEFTFDEGENGGVSEMEIARIPPGLNYINFYGLKGNKSHGKISLKPVLLKCL